MKRQKSVVVVAFAIAGPLAALVLGTGLARTSRHVASGEDATAPIASPVVSGAASFQQNCAFCHGKEGKGDGVAAYLLWPKPRDFTLGQFKFRTTHAGEPPSDEDLLRTITEGLPGSSMLAWRWLPEAERKALVQEVKRLSVFKNEDDEVVNWFAVRAPGTPVEVSPEPKMTDASIALGMKVYFRTECNKCHGGEGKGDGPSAAGLKDNWGYPIVPRDFTSGVFKGGGANRDLYLRTLVGVEGTPMPGYARDVMTEEERWGLVHFVRSLTQRPEDRPAVQAIDGELLAKRVTGEVPTLPEDPRWDSLPSRQLPLIQLFQRGRTSESLEVRAAHDGKNIAFLLDWADATANTEVLRVQDFRDGAAIQFAVKGPTTPLMGAPGMPVNIWHWKADWQAELGIFRDVEHVYPWMQMDMFPMMRGDQTLSHRGRPASALSTEPGFLTGTAAKNPLSAMRRTSPVEDLNAVGFGTLTPQPAAQQNVQGAGEWMGGHWRVVFTRAMDSSEKDDARFPKASRVSVSFAVWDGAIKDRNGQKNVTPWYTMAIE